MYINIDKSKKVKRGGNMEDLKLTKKTVFISYCHDDVNETWIDNLAAILGQNGIETIVDIYDLRLGQDLNYYMEKIKKVDKVLMLLGKNYKEKANNREGGVGVETQIISPDVYKNAEQTKFIPIVISKNEEDKPYLPYYLESRTYTDFSEKHLFMSNIDNLVKEIYDMPKKVKPHVIEKVWVTELDNSIIQKDNDMKFQYKKEELKGTKINPLLEAIMHKDFDKATSLINKGMRLWDIDKDSFERALYEFLIDYDIVKFLVENKFNIFCFKHIYCVDENNYIWGIVARAYVSKNIKIVELLFLAGFSLFDYGQYIVKGKDYQLWKYCLVTRYEKEIIDLMLSYGMRKEDILFYVDNPDLTNQNAANYVKSNPNIIIKGYALNQFWKSELPTPQKPNIKIFMTKRSKELLQKQYEYNLYQYNELLKAQKKLIDNLSPEELDFISKDEGIQLLILKNNLFKIVAKNI